MRRITTMRPRHADRVYCAAVTRKQFEAATWGGNGEPMSRPSRATRAAAALDYAGWLRRRAAEAETPEQRARLIARARAALSKTEATA